MKTPKFIKSDLIKAVADVTGLSKPQAESAINATLSMIRVEAISGKSVQLQGFGRFEVKERAARVARNPRTGEPVDVAASRALTFRAAKLTS